MIKLNILICVLFLGTALSFLMIIAGGGVLNDLNEALVEIREIEKNNLLNDPPPNTSSIALREIELSGNSARLEKYINETEEELIFFERLFYILMTLFIASIFVRYYWGRKIKRQKELSTQT